MKRRRSLICLLSALLGAVLLRGTALAEEGESGPFHTTVMIYMCGSDLESRFGAASNDISEMLSAGFDPEYTSVVIMAGGAKHWNTGFDPGATTIVELGARGMRPVWRSDSPLSMAESSTLTAFLDYSFLHYPADRYGLIIWDHGGGPNEGACYDELFGWNTLSVKALNNAIHDSHAAIPERSTHKLDWIGFDACLMASAETAFTLSGRADYLIASQEQEPSAGWNYAFLKGMENDCTVEDTARRIIDAFFDDRKSDHEALTLSCISLEELPVLHSAMQNYFDGLYPKLNDESYPELSRDRTSARSFGRAVYDETVDSDLVDLIALVEANGDSDLDGERLIKAVKNAVVYSRSSVKGAHGLSVYHPYYNHQVYTEKWAEQYETNFYGVPSAYMQYIRRFGQILTGGELGDWSGMETVRTLRDDGSICFSLTLSEAQAKQFDHATLLKVEQIGSEHGIHPAFYSVWETEYLKLNEDNTITAVYPGKAVYVVDDSTGETLAGPINYRITEDGQFQISITYYDESGILDPEKLITMYYCSFSEEKDSLSVDSISVYNVATRDYSSRMTVEQSQINEMDYVYALFYVLHRFPTMKGEELFAYQDWDTDDGFYAAEIRLPDSWHFEVREDEDYPELEYVSFQVSNTQNRTHGSSLCQVFPELVKTYEGTVERQQALPELELNGVQIRHYCEMELITVEFDLNILDDRIRSVSVKNPILNGVQPADCNSSAYDGAPLILSLSRENLLGLTELQTIELNLDVRYRDYQNNVTEQAILVSLEEPIPLDLE